VNASFENGRLKLHEHVNVGVALGTEEALVVAVVHDADQKSLVQITKEIKEFQDKGARMRFAVEDFAGGTFTLSNLGMFGVQRFNAIINPPQSAILAAGQIVQTPRGIADGNIALRPVMSLTLSLDHRSIDGMQGAKFLALVKELLEQPYLLLD
jgi:pyruvate dehydrogenase E2 component (dihydrolipoamide acetyltransferase)